MSETQPNLPRKVTSLKCDRCSGTMLVTRLPKFGYAGPFCLLIVGAVSIVPFGSTGIVILVVGIYMAAASESSWVCQDCKTKIPRA